LQKKQSWGSLFRGTAGKNEAGPAPYIHRNPVRRGLVSSPEQWAWSSFRHYLSGAEGIVEIESHQT
jgi:hypothetical protein